MKPGIPIAAASGIIVSALTMAPASASPFSFTTGEPDHRMATASRPSSAGKIEIESADDFILGDETRITSATFTGLLTGATLADIGNVRVEIYRVFPKDSDTNRPITVPTRDNSPSDVALKERDVASGTLSFTPTVLSNNFAADNSVLNGIHPQPAQTTGGEGQVTGTEVQFSVTLSTPLLLLADHFFFVPQVEITNADGQFFWLSAAGPLGPPDLQEWIRNEDLAPDWLRVGTDIVGGGMNAPKFNASFSLAGDVVPEPATLSLVGVALLGLGLARRRWVK